MESDALFAPDAAEASRADGPARGQGRSPAAAMPPRRWPCGCGRGRWTRSSGRRTCWGPARRCAGWSRATRRCRCCCTARPAPARPRWRTLVAGDGTALRRALGAVTAGVKEVRAVDRRRPARRCAGSGRQTVLFVDEVHRFSKTQQDALLPRGRRTAGVCSSRRRPRTRRSPSSRRCCRARCVLTLQPLTDDDVRDPAAPGASPTRAAWAGRSRSTAEAEDAPRPARGRRRPPGADRAGGGGRRGRGGGRRTGSTSPTVERAVTGPRVRYDRDGDQHYDVISAFIKSIRGSDVDAALHYLARMLVAGEDPRFVARRLMVHASEDIGLADPTALPAAVAAAQVVALVGLPEARIALAQAVIAPGDGAEVERGRHRDRRRAGRRARAARSARCRRTCATGTTPARASWARRRLPLPARRPRGRGRPAVPARRAGRPRLLPADDARRRAGAGRAAAQAARRRPRPLTRPHPPATRSTWTFAGDTPACRHQNVHVDLGRRLDVDQGRRLGRNGSVPTTQSSRRTSRARASRYPATSRSPRLARRR